MQKICLLLTISITIQTKCEWWQNGDSKTRTLFVVVRSWFGWKKPCHLKPFLETLVLKMHSLSSLISNHYHGYVAREYQVSLHIDLEDESAFTESNGISWSCDISVGDWFSNTIFKCDFTNKQNRVKKYVFSFYYTGKKKVHLCENFFKHYIIKVTFQSVTDHRNLKNSGIFRVSENK